MKNGNVQISPRMDFDEWTPLGRGDPLKNDPTFDYLPPVLDKVLYWKPPPLPGSRAHPSTAAPLVPQPAVTYNRRFFLTDFSKREPAVMAAGPYTPYAYKRHHHTSPPAAVQTIHTSSSPLSSYSTPSGSALQHGYRYPTMPRTPLPMLTPPPYQRPTSVGTTAEPFADRAAPANGNDLQYLGDSAAESKQPPAVRAPAPKPPRPVLSHSVIKVLLENEVLDRTTVTTMAAPTTTTATTTTTTTTTEEPPSTTDNQLFSRYRQPAVAATGGEGGGSRPMFLIIQGHSKVKTYGLVSKPDDLSAAQSAGTAIQEHNHIGNGPDEPSRRKRDGGKVSAVVTVREKL